MRKSWPAQAGIPSGSRLQGEHLEKGVDQEIEQVTQETAEVVQKNTEVDQKTMAQSKRLSQETISTILYAINNNAYISIKEMMTLTGCGSTTMKRYLNILVNNGTISHHGPDNGGFRTINWDKE